MYYINIRENQSGNHELTIQIHWSNWGHKTQTTQPNTTQHSKLKWWATRNPSNTWGEPVWGSQREIVSTSYVAVCLETLWMHPDDGDMDTSLILFIIGLYLYKIIQLCGRNDTLCNTVFKNLWVDRPYYCINHLLNVINCTVFFYPIDSMKDENFHKNVN